MTPDEVRALNSKMDDMIEVLGDVRVDVASIKAEQKAHADAHIERDSHREATCPHGQGIQQIRADMNALAGVQRQHHETIVCLQDWKAAIESDIKVDGAKKKVIWAPWLWLKSNTEKALLAVLIAYLLMKFGL